MSEKNSIFDNFKLDSAEYIEEVKEKIEPVIEKVTDDSKKKEDPVKKEDIKKEAVEKTVEKKEKIEPVDDDVFSFTPLISHLSGNSILKPKENAEYEDSEKGLEDIVNDTIDAKLEEKISSLPEQVQRLIKLGIEGVNVAELQKFEDIDFAGVDLEDVVTQENLTLDHLIFTGHDETEAKDIVEGYKDSNTLAKHSKIAHRILSKAHETRKNEFIETQKAEAKAKEIADKEKVTNFKKEVLETEKIGDFVLPKAEREKLYDYMTKPVKDGKTQSQLDDTEKNRLLLAYLRMKKFDMTDIEKGVQTKKTIDLKKALVRFKDTNAATTTHIKEEEEKISNKIPAGPWDRKK